MGRSRRQRRSVCTRPGIFTHGLRIRGGPPASPRCGKRKSSGGVARCRILCGCVAHRLGRHGDWFTGCSSRLTAEESWQPGSGISGSRLGWRSRLIARERLPWLLGHGGRDQRSHHGQRVGRDLLGMSGRLLISVLSFARRNVVRRGRESRIVRRVFRQRREGCRLRAGLHECVKRRQGRRVARRQGSACVTR
jgi:hypothetical protein